MQKVLIITFFCVLIISPVVAWMLGINLELYENRALATMPNISLENLGDQTFYSNIEKYFNDHFVFRAGLIRPKSWVDYYIFNTSPSTQVHIGEDGWLYYDEALHDYLKNDCPSAEEMNNLAHQLHDLEEIFDTSGKKFIFTIAPDKSTVYPEYVGFERPPSRCQKSRYDLFIDSLSEYPLKNFIRLDIALIEEKNRYQVYFKADTHYNYRAAVVVSTAVLNHLAPGSWAECFPQMEMSPVKLERPNLPVMMALDFGGEMIEFPKNLDFPSRISIENRKPLENGRPRYRIESKSTHGNNLLPRTIMYRDSMMDSPLILLQGCFEQLDVYWTNDLLHKEAREDLKNSQIVILEIVERILNQLKVDPLQVKDALFNH
jgi:hypothetical protein